MKHISVKLFVVPVMLIIAMVLVAGCGDDGDGKAALNCEDRDTGCVDGEPCYDGSDCVDALLCVRENDEDETGICGISPVEKCNTVMERWCDRNDFCEVDSKELCLRRVAESITCSLATWVTDSYETCLVEIDAQNCLTMGEMPPSCWNMISFE